MNSNIALKEFDKAFYNESIKIIAGVDEAGRGPLAGPVVAAAVIFDKDFHIEGVNDSKKVSASKREELFDKIICTSLSCGIGIVDNEEIDSINILQASLKAMKIAVSRLTYTPDLVLIDGNKTFNSSLNLKAIVKGDSKSFSIAAASIIAKVTRDRLMQAAALEYPVYGWESNKGYPTKKHFDYIEKFGITPLHRKSFLKKAFGEELKLFAAPHKDK